MKMNKAGTTLLFLLASATLISGCQTAQSPGSTRTETTQPEPAAPAATPPALVAPTTAPKTDTEVKPRESASEPAAMSMTIAELQRRLAELGYKPGPADGKAGQRTTNALKKFQHDHKLPVTGVLDAETIRVLQKP